MRGEADRHAHRLHNTSQRSRGRAIRTRGNSHKLIQHHCHCDLRKFIFTNRVIPIWNSLTDYAVSAETVNTFKNRLDRFWSNHDVLYRADLHGINNRTIVM